METQSTIIASLEALPELESILLPLISDVDEETRDTLRLVVQELCTNIVVHAYDGAEGNIDAHFRREGSDLWLEFRDYAPNSFSPPDEIKLPDPHSLPNGGWGLSIIHQGVNQVNYERLPTGNRWRLHKQLI